MRRARYRTRLGRGAALVLTMSACDAEPPLDTFIALQRDFDDFADWEVVWSEIGEDALVHAAGLRTVYVNRRPTHAITPLPVGTIVLKTIEDPDFNEIVQIHAMAKRGADYNADGAVGWEWFDLQRDESAHPVIVWRGAHPPAGECYHCPPGTDPAAAAMMSDCNDCHADAGVDSVLLWRSNGTVADTFRVTDLPFEAQVERIVRTTSSVFVQADQLNDMGETRSLWRCAQ